MVLSKDQVKSHIAGVESRISDPLELKHHGYEFAKLLYQVKEYDSAVIYLDNFISVNGRDPRAHKLMGHLCNATAENGKAIAHYKRSLELKRGQRDVIEALVSVYLKLEKPPVGSLKECLQHIEAIGQTHPLIVPLCEKIQSLEGGFSMEKVINKALAVNTNDVNLHIRLVKLYCQSGKRQEAFHYCEDLYRAGQLTDSLQWQLFALATAEDYYENVRAKGVRDGVETLEILVTLLEFTTTLFNLLACPDGDLDDSAALLLKFDKVLCASGQMLSVLPPSALPLFQMALKQLCAQLYFMAGRYLYLLAWRQRQSLLSSVNVASIMGMMCMLSSMKAPPWDLEQYRTLDQRTHLRLRTWYNAACARTSIAGRHLMLIEAVKGKLFFEILPKIATEMGGKLHLIKTLFGGTTSRNLRAKFGSRDIKFSLQESFLSEDGTFLTLPVLPSARELEDYDRECIAQERQLCNLLWRCLAYKALNKQPFLFLWLGRMFNDLRLDTPTLDSTEPSTLCVLDFEAFLVHLLMEYSERLTSPQLFSVPPMTTVTLTTALASCLPFCLILKDSHRHYWTALLTFLLGNLSAQDAAGVKKVVREFLSFVRGSSPLQLSLEHLTSLARHFKKRAEMETDGGDDRDIIMMLLKRSCHYWAIVEDILSPSSDSSQSALLAEARMTIANEALYRQDMSKALRLYSRVKTAPSAWNQSEVYLHLADMSGQADTREKLDSRLDNLQKAAEALDLAIARLTPEHEIKNLRQKFLSQKDSIKDLLGETKNSPLACALDYEEESPSVHRRFSSTPAHTKTPPLSHMTSPFTDQSRKQEQKLSEMASQLEKLQAEMDLIKSRTTRTYNQSQTSPQGHTMYPGMQSHSETILSYGPRLLPPADPPFQGQLSPHGLSPQGLSQQWSAGQLPHFHGQTSPRQTSPLNMFQLQPNRAAMFSQQRSPLQRYPTPPPAVAQPSNSFQGVATGIQTFTTPPRPFAPRSPINRPPHSVESFTTPPRPFAPRSPINRPPHSVESFTTPPRPFAPRSPINRPPHSVESFTTPPRPFAPRSPINRPPHSVESFTTPPRPFAPRSPINRPPHSVESFTTPPRPFVPRSPINRPPHSVGLTLPQHLQSHSFIPAIGGPQLISPNAKPLSPGAASNTETMPTTNEQVVSTTPQNRLSLTPKFQPPALAHFSPSIQPTAGLGNLSPSQQPLPVKNTALPFTVSATSPKSDDITTKSGMKRTASGFGVLQSPLFSFTTPVTFTFGQATSSTPQFPAFGMTTTADGTGKPLTTSKELPSIVPKSYSFPVNIQPPPSSVPVRTSSGHTFTMPTMNLTTSPLLATSAKTSQPFSIPGNSSLFTFANTSPTQSPVVTSVQTETIATSKETFPFLSSLLSKNWTGSQPSTAAIGGGLLPKEAPKIHGDYVFTGTSIFSNKSNNAEQDQEDSSGAHDTSDNDPQFYSIVSLPELDNILSGEEDEETLFVERAKLYRFHKSEWKDKGLGEMKVLKHRSTGKIRLLMRRDQILKICCNHYVVPAMKFKYLQDNKRMLCWFTNAEFSDEEIKSEKLAIKFKTDEIATNFKQTVEFAVEELGKTDASNKSSNSIQKLESDTEQLTQTGSDIRGRLAPPKGSWSCDVCLVTNKESANECVACSTKNPNSAAVNTTSNFPPLFGEGGTFSTTSTANSLSFGESGGFKLPTGLSFGTTHVATAPTGGFKMPLLSTTATAPTGGFKMPVLSTATTTAATGIRGRLAPPKGSWSCDVCLVTNKESANECVACSTKNPNSAAVNTTSNFPTLFGEGGTFSTTSTANSLSFGESGGFKLPTGLSFGTTHAATAPTGGFKMPLLSTTATAPTGGFKMPVLSTATTTAATGIRGRLAPPKGSWSCDVCLVTNKESANECVACSTKNPNSAAVNTTSNFPTLFGEGGTFSTTSTANSLSFGESGGFKLPTGLSFGTTHAATAPTGGFKMPLLSTTATAPTGGFKMPLLSTAATAPTDGFKLAFSTTALSGGFQSRSGLTFPSFSFAATTQQETEKYEDRESTEEDSGSGTPDHHVSRSDPVDELSDVEEDSTDSVLFVSEEMPPPEKVELAKKYLLPITFFNYEKKPLCPGCRGCTEDPPALEQPGDPEPRPNSEASGDNSSETVSREEGNKVVEDGAGVKQEDGLKEITITSFSFLPSEGKASSFSELASGGGFQWSSGKSQGFSGAGRPLFGSSSGGKDGEGDPETEVDITFKPLVTLPEVETKTGEEFDEAMFSHRAKLYRFDSNVNQWKERGVGDIKITRNKTTNKTRIIMRRDLIKKLCCNHFINSVKYLTPNQGSDRSWVWYTPGDFSDGEARPEKLAVRFKYQETATEFKNVFDKCKQLEVSPDPDLTTEKPEECEEGKSPVGAPTEVRSNVIEQDVISNTSSNEESHDSVSEHDETDGDSIADDNNQLLGEDLRLKLAPPPGAWTCVACLVSNKPTATHCVACNGTDREETTEVSTPPLKLAPPPGAWTCVACLVSNKPTATRCVACNGTDREKTTEVSTPPLAAVNICSPDSSTNLNPLLRFPLILSPVSTVPYVCPKPVPPLEMTPLETENPLPITPATKKDRLETSPLETENPLPVTPDTRNETSPLETENPLPITPDTRNETSPLETENPLPITPATKKDGSHSQSEPTLSETESQVDDNDQEDDVVFLCEDLPDLELVAKAKQLMLPPSFFLYEKKTPCSGCRGCRDESDVESDVEDISTHSESDASITQDPPEEITFAPAKQPPSPVGKPKGFFSQADQVSFSDLAPQTTSGFATTTPGFQFQGAGKQLFAVRSADDGKANPEEEIDINFKPLVSLPKVAPTKSWDNEAGTLFSNRGKLFRFDDSVNQWKERGVGDIKILQHTGTGRCRILMRRDQILKICCNHNITADMTLLPGNTDKSWIWFTQSDFTDEEPKKEKLAVRFKHAETAREFKEVFEQCVKRDTEL